MWKLTEKLDELSTMLIPSKRILSVEVDRKEEERDSKKVKRNGNDVVEAQTDKLVEAVK